MRHASIPAAEEQIPCRLEALLCFPLQGWLSHIWQAAVLGLGGVMGIASMKLRVSKGRVQSVLPMYGVVFASEESSLKSS